MNVSLSPSSFGDLQHDDGVPHRAILAEDGDGGVRRILGKTVVTRAPIRDDIGGELVAGGSNRTIGEDDGAAASRPVNVNVSPCSVAPRELSTNSEGTISGLAAAAGVPIVFMAGAV